MINCGWRRPGRAPWIECGQLGGHFPEIGHHAWMARRPGELPPDLTKVAFTLEQGRRLGLTDRRMESGDLRRPFRGVRQAVEPPGGEVSADIVADGSVDVSADVSADRYRSAEAELIRRCLAVELVLAAGAFFTHHTAARLWPLPIPGVPNEGPLHVGVMPPECPPRRIGTVGHAISDPAAYTVRRGEHLLIDPGTLFCQLSKVLRVEDLVAVGDALVLTPHWPDERDDRPWLDLSTLQERVERFRGRGKARADRAVQRVRTGSESRPESLVRLAIVDAGLPEPEVNVEVHTDNGVFVGRADLLYRRYRLAVEYDGDHHRVDTKQYDRDAGRMDDFAAAGWRVVRVTKRSFFGDRDAFIARVRRALFDAGWRP